MVLHELFFLSSSFPARVRAQVHVRSDLDALPFAPLFLFGPLSPLFGSFWGYPFRLVLGLPPVRHSPGLREGCTVHFLASSSCLSPFLFLAPRSCPVRQPCFRCPAGPASVSLALCAAPRLLLPLVFYRQAYGPPQFFLPLGPVCACVTSARTAWVSPELLAQLSSCLVLFVGSLTAMDSALAGYRSSDEETGPLGEIITGESILLPPELVFSGDALGCLTCYASSDEDQTDRDAPAASSAQAPAPPGVTAWSDPAR